MKNKIDRALERTTDTKECLIGAGVVSRTGELFVKSFGGAKAIVVADKNTWAVAGKDVQASLDASGTEHQYSHCWDMENLSYPDGTHVSHGFKVGVGTLISTASLEFLLKQDLAAIDTDALVAAWPELRGKIESQIIPFKEVYDYLKAVGAPYQSEMICVTREHFIQTFDYIPYMRSRFTNVDAIYRLGLLPHLKKYLFSEKGVI